MKSLQVVTYLKIPFFFWSPIEKVACRSWQLVNAASVVGTKDHVRYHVESY